MEVRQLRYAGKIVVAIVPESPIVHAFLGRLARIMPLMRANRDAKYWGRREDAKSLSAATGPRTDAIASHTCPWPEHLTLGQPRLAAAPSRSLSPVLDHITYVSLTRAAPTPLATSPVCT